MDRSSGSRPAYPSLSTATASNTSVFQNSASSISSTMSSTSAASSTTQDSPLQQRSTSYAPLPSPTVSDRTPFFGTMHPQMSQQQQTAAQLQQRVVQIQQYQYQPERTGAGATAQETASYIKDYALVAEAAKRAQMAVLARDMEGFQLT